MLYNGTKWKIFEKGVFMKRWISLLIACLFLYTVVYAEKSTFEDMDNTKWYSDWVNIINNLDLASGYPDGTFNPENPLKRIELLSLTMKTLGYDSPVSQEYWGQNIIDKAFEINLISNQSNDLMYNDPDGYITREETARVIYNAYLMTNVGYNSTEEQDIRNQIADMDEVASIYSEGVIGIYYLGIVEGYTDKSFKPKNTLTRAEASVFISRLILKDKRIQVQYNVPTYSFVSSNPNIPNFTLRYDEENQDLVNIHKLIDAVENADTSQGFAEMTYNLKDRILNATLYESEKLFNSTDSQSELNPYKQWSIYLNQAKGIQEYDDIRLITWRNNEALNRIDTIKLIFDYLFGADSARIYEKFMHHYDNAPVDGYFEVRTISNDRKVLIVSDETSVELLVSKKSEDKIIMSDCSTEIKGST